MRKDGKRGNLQDEFLGLKKGLAEIKADRSQLEAMEEKLEKAIRELEVLEEIKDNIITNVTHELRTPLTIAVLAIDLALQAKGEEEMTIHLERAAASLLKQDRIIEDLLQGALSENRRLELKTDRVSVLDIAKKALESHLQEAKDKDIQIDVDIPELYINADLSKIKQAMSNLIHNSIKFTGPKGRIKVWAKERGRNIEICVEDNGIGIPDDLTDKVFERLYQVDNSETRRFGGTGMGLSVARDVIEYHGGKIWVTSMVGKGSTFHFTLPATDASGEELKNRFNYFFDGSKRMPN